MYPRQIVGVHTTAWNKSLNNTIAVHQPSIVIYIHGAGD